MKRLLVLAMLMFAGAAYRESASYPVAVLDVRNIEDAMYVYFQNNASTTLNSYEFAFIFVDLAGKQHIFPLFVSGTKSVPSGDGGAVSLPTSTTMQYLFPEANAYLIKATFSDGTTWKDD